MKKNLIIIKKISIIFFLLCGLFFTFDNFVFAVNKYTPNETIVIGEFVYDDDFVATTTDCWISIYNPVGNPVLTDYLMTTLPNGWHYYSTSTINDEGIWPTTMTCGSVLRGDIANLDKTFAIGYVGASTTAISNSVWNNSATTSIASGVNINTIAALNIASSSIVDSINSNTTNVIESASSSLGVSILALPSVIWNYTGRTLSNFGSLVSDIVTGVWGATTRTLSNSLLGDGGNIALQSDITSATNNINSNTNTTVLNASTSLASTIPTAVWANDDRSLTTFGSLVADVWQNSTAATSSLAAADVWSYATRNLTTANLNSGSLAIQTDLNKVVTDVKNNTDLAIDSASSSLGINIAAITTDVNAHNDSQLAAAVTAINNNTNATVLEASTSLTSTIPVAVWANDDRSLTTFGSLVADVWQNSTAATSSLAAADVWSYATRTLTSIGQLSPWSISVSDFGTVTAGGKYLSTVTTVYNGTLTDSLNMPVVTIYDSNRNIIVSNVVMTKVGTGTYSYSYSTAANAPEGTWESVFSVTIESDKTLLNNDYWNIVSSPAQVIINNISDNVIPQIGANVTITNEGLSGYEYQYEWCVVSSINNSCGGGDDIFHAVAAKYINAGQDFNTTLTANIPNVGNYYFKMIVYFGTDSSGASRSFEAVSGVSVPPTVINTVGGGGGGGLPPAVIPQIDLSKVRKSDFSQDGIVNSADFSILMYYWKSKPPFKNQFVDINKDGKIDSVDFSILLYEWDKKK